MRIHSRLRPNKTQQKTDNLWYTAKKRDGNPSSIVKSQTGRAFLARPVLCAFKGKIVRGAHPVKSGKKIYFL